MTFFLAVPSMILSCLVLYIVCVSLTRASSPSVNTLSPQIALIFAAALDFLSFIHPPLIASLHHRFQFHFSDFHPELFSGLP